MDIGHYLDFIRYVGISQWHTLFYQFTAHQHPILLLIGIQNLFGGLLLLPFAQPLGWWAALHYHVFALAVWYQVIFVSLIAMLMWFQLVRWFGSANASVFHLLNPIFATLLTWYFFHISLGWLDILGTLLVILALGILNFHRQFKQSRFH